MVDISRQFMQDIREPINEALKKVGEDHGIVIELGHGRYGGTSGSFKLELSTVGEDGIVITKEAEAFSQLADMYLLDPNWLGKSFSFDGDTFTIVGWKARARKRPVLCDKASGGRSVWTATSVKNLMENEHGKYVREGTSLVMDS